MAGLSGRGMAVVVLISTLAAGVLGGAVLERFVLSNRPDGQIGPRSGPDGFRRAGGPRRRDGRERSAAHKGAKHRRSRKITHESGHFHQVCRYDHSSPYH